MANYLLVAHQTAESQELLEAARKLAGDDPGAQFVMLVPATPIGHMLVWEEGETTDVARKAAEAAQSWLRGQGLEVIEAVVGDADPIHAIGDEIRARKRRYDGIVLSTLPPGISRWLGMDVVSRVRRNYPAMKVVHVVSQAPARTS